MGLIWATVEAVAKAEVEVKAEEGILAEVAELEAETTKVEVEAAFGGRDSRDQNQMFDPGGSVWSAGL